MSTVGPAIGLVGYAQSGKDSVANVLVDYHGYKRVSFADKMREFMYAMDPLVEVEAGDADRGADPEMMNSIIRSLSGWGATRYVSYQSLVDAYGYERVKKIRHVRELLQRLGTEAGRGVLGPNVWVNAAMRGIQPGDKVVFTDVRFDNERDVVLNLQGEIWLIERRGIAAPNGHSSEDLAKTYMRGRQLPHEWIYNNGTLDELKDEVDYTIGDFHNDKKASSTS